MIDYSRNGSEAEALSPTDLEHMKRKPDGSRRVVLAYLSIGEAESYRYYWKRGWGDLWIIPNFWSKPAWRAKLNGDWGGNYAVRYWDPAWQSIILGDGGYLDRIVKAGFDGVWLDKVDSCMEDVAAGRPSAKTDMVAFVRRIADRSRAAKPGFLVFPQNGEAILAEPGYLDTIDGLGRESLLFGEEGAGTPNREASVAKATQFLGPLLKAGKPVLAVEYLDNRATIDQARPRLASIGVVPHFATRELDGLRVGDYGTTVTSTSGNGKRRALAVGPAGWIGLAFGTVVALFLWRRLRRG